MKKSRYLSKIFIIFFIVLLMPITKKNQASPISMLGLISFHGLSIATLKISQEYTFTINLKDIYLLAAYI